MSDDSDSPWGSGKKSEGKSPWGNSGGNGGRRPQDDRPTSIPEIDDMVRKGQVVTLSITIPDKPGQLQAVSGICANAGANVLAVEHGRFALDLAASSARLDITIETRDHDHATEIIQIIRSAGYLATILESD